MVLPLFHSRWQSIVGAAIVSLLLVPSFAGAQSASRRALPATPQEQLSLAITLFASDDDSPQAERLFANVIGRTAVTTSDGAAARYYLGRLYHRNYYMLRQQNGISLAVDKYKEVHNRGLGAERGGPWYAEARFYKSLAYLELGKWKDAYEAVDHIDPSLDPDLEIDYLVWTIDKRPINRHVPTAALRSAYLELLKSNNVSMSRPDGGNPAASAAIISALQNLLQRWGTAAKAAR